MVDLSADALRFCLNMRCPYLDIHHCLYLENQTGPHHREDIHPLQPRYPTDSNLMR
uniref:Uncharacterized protein n=1 Tax=Rhizophora mucronata TaxID=61149 RepID=A0A2P2N0N8_RHIMU